MGFDLNAERFELLDRTADYRQIAVAAHNNGYFLVGHIDNSPLVLQMYCCHEKQKVIVRRIVGMYVVDGL
jgi:hypothetical protein